MGKGIDPVASWEWGAAEKSAKTHCRRAPSSGDRTPTVILRNRKGTIPISSRSQCLVDGRNDRGAGGLLLQISNACHLGREADHPAGDAFFDVIVKLVRYLAVGCGSRVMFMAKL
uniref:Uncharacterized protein n=1 Tax=Rhizobium leguminosarum TaxID=384 RepID=A0A154IPI1_RHILE|nr:hypothetical protein A4A59_10465 [Rhizobium leguminosarum]